MHASTAVFLGILLVGFAVVRFALARRDLRATAIALAWLYVPVAFALVWLLLRRSLSSALISAGTRLVAVPLPAASSATSPRIRSSSARRPPRSCAVR